MINRKVTFNPKKPEEGAQPNTDVHQEILSLPTNDLRVVLKFKRIIHS